MPRFKVLKSSKDTSNQSNIQQKTNIIVGSAQQAQVQNQSLQLSAAQNKISTIRDNSLKKDKWNLYVGDKRYKTNFFLQFLDRLTKKLYERQLVPSSLYSLRLLIIAMFFFDVCFTGYDHCATEGCFLTRIFVLILTLITLLCLSTFYFSTSKILFAFVVLFSIFEKIKKEQFIIGITNSKTKKLLLALINQAPFSIAIVTSDGQIQFCNQTFENMLFKRLGLKIVPQSVFKLTSGDEESSQKLKGLIADMIRPIGIGSTLQNLKNSESSFYPGTTQSNNSKDQGAVKKIEVRLSKNFKKKEDGKGLLKEESKDETKTKTISDKDVFNQKDLFDKFEIAQVNGEQINYLSKKAIMLTFNIVSEKKAKSRLIYLHSQLMYKLLNQFTRRLQQLNTRAIREEEVFNNSSIVEFIGTTYVAINQVQQIQHEFWTQSSSFKSLDENFLLRDEILQCVESLSVKCLSPNTTLKLDANRNLPELLAGDLQKFRLALQAVSEFSMKYCTEGIIEILINFDTMLQDQKCQICFDFTFTKNSSYNEEPLLNLLNGLNKNSQSNYEEILLKNYEDVFNLISQFGIGIIIFPSLIINLDGMFTIQSIDSQDNQEEQKEVFKDQDQAPANKGKIKILFKIPFSQGREDKKVLSPYTPINRTKTQHGTINTYKSPNLISRETREQDRNQMKRMMEKSPLIGSRNAMHQKNDSQVITRGENDNLNCGPGSSKDIFKKITPQSFDNNIHNMGSNIFDNQSLGNVSFHCGSGNNNNGVNTSNYQKNKSSNIDKNQVKKVENTLKNLESKQNQDFFQNKVINNCNIYSPSFDEIGQQTSSMIKNHSQNKIGTASAEIHLDIKKNENQKGAAIADGGELMNPFRAQSMNYIRNDLMSKDLKPDSKRNESSQELINHSSLKRRDKSVNRPSLFGNARNIEEESNYNDQMPKIEIIEEKKNEDTERNLVSKSHHLEDNFEQLNNLNNNSRISSQRSFQHRGYANPHEQQQKTTRKQQLINKNNTSQQDELRQVLSFGQLSNKLNFQNKDQSQFLMNQNPIMIENLQDFSKSSKKPTPQLQGIINHEIEKQNLKFAESPIDLSDGQENFNSEMISEDETSEILAQLTKENIANNDFEEEKTQQPNISNSFDNSFQRDAFLTSMKKNNKKIQKSKRSIKHLPLSKHIPKDILSSSTQGASKNLLGPNFDPESSGGVQQVPSKFSTFGAMVGQLSTQKIAPLPKTPQNQFVNSFHLQNDESFNKTAGQPQRLSSDQRNMQESDQQQEGSNQAYHTSENTMQYQLQLMTQDYQLRVQNNKLNVWNQQTIEELKRQEEELWKLPNGELIKHNPSQQAQGVMHRLISPITWQDNSKRYVLVAEDNQMISFVLQETLKTIDYVPIIAENGKIAVEKFTNFMREGMFFDLILMDLLMPEMGGYEATQLIRKAEADYGLLDKEKHYICGFSAEVDEKIRKRCLECGMNDLVPKPMSKDRLESLLNQCKREIPHGGEDNYLGLPSKNFIDAKDLTILPGRSNQFSNL